MGVCVCVSKSLLNLKLTTSIDWSGKKRRESCPEIKLLGSTENKQPYLHHCESVPDIFNLSLTASERQMEGPGLYTSAAF